MDLNINTANAEIIDLDTPTDLNLDDGQTKTFLFMPNDESQQYDIHLDFQTQGTGSSDPSGQTQIQLFDMDENPTTGVMIVNNDGFSDIFIGGDPTYICLQKIDGKEQATSISISEYYDESDDGLSSFVDTGDNVKIRFFINDLDDAESAAQYLEENEIGVCFSRKDNKIYIVEQGDFRELGGASIDDATLSAKISEEIAKKITGNVQIVAQNGEIVGSATATEGTNAGEYIIEIPDNLVGTDYKLLIG